MTEQHTQPKPATSAKAEKKFRILSPGDRVDRCNYMLPNRLQCWKAGEEEVTDTNAQGEKTVYQLCERHVRIQRAIDAGLLKPENIDTPLKEMTTAVPDLPREQPEATKEEVPPPQGEPKKEQEHSGDTKQQENKQQQTSQHKQQEEKR